MHRIARLSVWFGEDRRESGDSLGIDPRADGAVDAKDGELTLATHREPWRNAWQGADDVFLHQIPHLSVCHHVWLCLQGRRSPKGTYLMQLHRRYGSL